MGRTLGCDYCKADPCFEPGYIEMPDNGPIVACPICNNEDDYTLAEQQRDLQRRSAHPTPSGEADGAGKKEGGADE